MNQNKSIVLYYPMVFLVMLFCFVGSVAASDNQVCSAGAGVPPFLSSGLNPNLLLVVDNSGSMLDTAYVDTNAANGGGACVDNDFDPSASKSYAGIFDSTKWYRWIPGVTQWQSGTAYTADQIVYTEGVFYRATSSATSNGVGIKSDTNVTWVRVHETAKWVHGITYPAKSFVQYDNQLFYTVAGGTANDSDPSDGISIYGDVGVAWTAVNSTWIPGNVYAVGDIVSANGRLYRATVGGTATTWAADASRWARLDEGYFEEVSYASVADAIAAFAGSPGAVYTSDNVYVKIVSVGDTPSGVTAFAATGKLLNWLSSSKLDIQKKILTGGKYDTDLQQLISQGRGCSSRGLVKEVPVTSSSGNRVITFSTRGVEEANWIDTADSTTRINIMGVSATGFIGSSNQQACQTAIDEVAKGDEANQGVIKQSVDDCLAYTGQNNILADSNAAYNHSIHLCWSIVQKGFTQPSELGNVSEVTSACEKIYTNGVAPATIDPEDSGYMCHGVYNHSLPGDEREGYVGRCWQPEVLASACAQKTCTTPNNGFPDRCFADRLVYRCNKNNANSCHVGDWAPVYVDGSGASCVPSSGTPAQWTNDNNPDLTTCVQEAMWDYCGALKVPEVIDPTDQLSNSSETWGMVGAMIDSGIVSKFGTDRPLIVMKGYVKPPVVDGAVVVPTGIIQDHAKDLRMGAMAFNINGAQTECQGANVNGTIVKYCPDENKDGAQVIAPIKDSAATTAGIAHLNYLVGQINNIRANSWTPLAEAMFNALGYYGQNSQFRINDTDFSISATDDPVQAWCQGNYVLVITEGASTADINSKVGDAIKSLQTIYPALEVGTLNTSQEGECTKEGQHYLYASTYLDDLTYFGQHADIAHVYSSPTMTTPDGSSEAKQPVTTYIVRTGNPASDTSTGECNAGTLMTLAATNGGTNLLPGENPEQLETSLRAAFGEILTRASSGSAASVISSSRGGEGAIYQAIFWPELEKFDATNKKYTVSWAGDVHGLFIDNNGYMYEDTNHDRILDKSVDKRVIVYFDESVKKSKACMVSPTVLNGVVTCSNAKELEEINFLWSASDWLSDFPFDNTGTRTYDPLFTETNRTVYISSERKRYIFTWNDKLRDGNPRNGIVNYDSPSEVVALEEKVPPVDLTSPDWIAWTTLATDYNATSGYELNRIISWLRGKDWLVDETPNDLNHNGVWDTGETDPVAGDGPPRTPLRSRQSVINGTSHAFTWRLGDVIHSTPQAVSAPAEGYHFIYDDLSYVAFVNKWKPRRHMVYFGGNDGMLHAVNAGFYSEKMKQFCLTPVSTDGTCSPGESMAPALGAEMWAYVPYNLHPHLKCLTDPSYGHKYFVDLKTRVFDVQIFTPDEDHHPNGWGTILVGGLGFGGTPVNAKEIDATETSNRKFISSYFILDITNPEQPPVLLGELTQEVDAADGQKWADLGYSTVIPTMVIEKQDNINRWYLVFGSGPHGVDGLKGVSDQPAKIGVFPLEGLVDIDNKPIKAFRIAKGTPSSATAYAGTFTLPNETSSLNGFVSDPVTIDFDINPSAAGKYVSDAVYFGTVEGDFATDAVSGARYWKGGGHLYRLVMNKSGHQIGIDDPSTPDVWSINKPLLDLSEGNANRTGGQGQSITAAPAAGTDGYNYWIYFGTGRFFDPDDKADTRQQSFYGIKEPMIPVIDTDTNTITGRMLTWETVEVPRNTSHETTPGSKGLLQVDAIQVQNTLGNGDLSSLTCRDNTTDCLPVSSVDTFGELENYIAVRGACVATDSNMKGNCCASDNEKNCVDGWYKDFYSYNNRERNLGQATLLGGLVTFTTYQPFADPCKAEGVSYLYGVYYKTGTSWYRNIFGEYGLEGVNVKNKLDLGRGLALTPNLFIGKGDQEDDGVRAFIQTSTGEIKEIKQENLPVNNFQTGRQSWREYQRN